VEGSAWLQGFDTFLITKEWGDGSLIANPEGSHFGSHALAYDYSGRFAFHRLA
jgi:hypothetical protein